MVHVTEPMIDDHPTPATAPPIRTIVVAADGSDGAERALEWAAQVAGSIDARVLAVHVLTPSRELARDFSLETMHTWRRELERQLRGPWVEPLRRRHLRHRCLLVEGDTAASGLLQAAARNHADLIVLGARGRSTLALTSTSHVLNRRAQCPVVVVPPAWQPATPT